MLRSAVRRPSAQPGSAVRPQQGLPLRSRLLSVKWEKDGPFLTMNVERERLPSRHSLCVPPHPTLSPTFLWAVGGTAATGRVPSGLGPMGARGRGPPSSFRPRVGPPRSSIGPAGSSGVPRGVRSQPRSPPSLRPLLPIAGLSAVPSGLDTMGDGGEGEDEVQFLRTVRISAGGFWAVSRFSEFSVLTADGL